MRDFLLEIGTEDLPASYVAPAYRQLATDAEMLFASLRLPWEELYATGTPRRIVLLVKGLAVGQEAAEETVTGPPVQIGWGPDGRPTKAAEGFARSHAVAVSELRPIATPRGEVLGFTRRLERRPADTLLAEHTPGLIGSLRFPKTMKWEPSGARFARPVRWVVCLFGSAVVPLTFAGVQSGRTSYGRPWIAGGGVRVRSAGSYSKDLARLGVVLDDDERRKRIWSLATAAAARSGLTPLQDPGLLDELTFMLEDPRALVGRFDESYLDLPAEVVTTAMRSHQRYVALVDDEGRLVSRFITFTEGSVRGAAGVRSGNEKVLRARLEDALFYWREDIKRGMDGLAGQLARIVFIEGLGTLGQKSDRIMALARSVNERRDKESRRPVELIDRAAAIAKADLASEMVKDGKEFTLLQGRIGSHYAAQGGEDPAVAAAVDQHYWPRTPSDPVPESPVGVAIGVADRVDTVCGCFLAGLVPSGSQDPYAVRRQANGLMRILERAPEIRLDDLLARSVDLYIKDGLAERGAGDEALVSLSRFFEARCEAFLKDQGVVYDIVAAVSRVSWPRPGVALLRAREITRSRGQERFERLVTGVKRVGNILSKEERVYGADWDAVRAALGVSGGSGGGRRFAVDAFDQPAESRLYEAVTRAVPRLIDLDRRHDFASVLEVLSSLADPIDAYFDQVLVNCQDPNLRQNRHSFLAAVFLLFSRYADFSCIVENG